MYSKFLAALVDGEVKDMSMKLSGDATVKFLTFEDAQGKEVFWHSSAHVLGAALENLFQGHLGHGPATD